MSSKLHPKLIDPRYCPHITCYVYRQDDEDEWKGRWRCYDCGKVDYADGLRTTKRKLLTAIRMGIMKRAVLDLLPPGRVEQISEKEE